VKSDAYRPIKVDGNPEHPMSKGGSDPISQGSLLGLYDPDRSQRVLYQQEASTWANFQRALIRDLPKLQGGQGLYILSSTITSPTLAAQWKDAQKRLPQAKLIQYDPVNRDSARRASKAAFGDFYDAQYMLDKADVILSLDSDFLSGITHPGFNKLADGSIHPDEPALRGREHAYDDRVQGRSPAESKGQPGGSYRHRDQRWPHTCRDREPQLDC
jgi:molybdopterin-containing oxidoreductase family iron-sulfur binding subunit